MNNYQKQKNNPMNRLQTGPGPGPGQTGSFVTFYKINPMNRLIKNTLKNKFLEILTWVGEFTPGNKTIYTVFDEESDFQVKIAQSQRPEVENRGFRFLIVGFLIVCLHRSIFR